MSDFFIKKVQNIQSGLEVVNEQNKSQVPEEEQLIPTDRDLTAFSYATEEEVRKMIMSSASKTCTLDPIPTHILKDCLDTLLPSITKIINLSLAASKFPDCFKVAAVSPLLKKANLDPNNLKNFRPVSNLPFISKILEKVVAKRLLDHKDQNSLHEMMQSAYRKNHSTETALVRIQNDILRDIDAKQCVGLVLLDMSAAFDTVDHTILLRRLSDRFGIKGAVLQWITSYLSDRYQFVTLLGAKSVKHLLDCNVPQGSVLGPGMFSDYNSPVGNIFRKHGIKFHLYADDTQVYFSFPPGMSEAESFQKLETCLEEVRLWMANNFLKLNDDKTDFIIMGSKHNLQKVSTTHIKLGNSQIRPNESVKNIGVVLDNQMKMDKQISKTCQAAWFHLFQISKIKKYLTADQLKCVVHAFITSKLDQNNALVFGLPKTSTSKLQSVQNAAAKMIFGQSRYNGEPAPLQQLHWLPVRQRITFKILLLTYKALHNQGPAYIKELLTPYNPSRSLRSSSANLLVEPKAAMASYGDRAFSIAAPKLWNVLPQKIKSATTVSSFKSALKTHLFCKSF